MNSNDFLAHYGIKGMKWGVRRTRAQLRKASDNYRTKRDPSTPEGAVRKQRKDAVKNRRILSDDEVNRLVSRMEKEKKLKDMVEADLNPGRSFARDVANNKGKALVGTVAAGAATVAIKKILTNHLSVNSKDADTIIRGKLKK